MVGRLVLNMETMVVQLGDSRPVESKSGGEGEH